MPSRKVIGATAVLALITAGLAIAIVFATSILFHTDYKFIYWGFLPFASQRVPGMFVVLPLYLTYYVIMSVSVNCFNFNNAVGKIKIINTLLLAFFAALPTLFIIGYVYGVFRATGWNPMFGKLASAATAVYALPGVVFVSIIGSRKIYEKTGNP
jgi:hypothetical protein